MPTTPAVFTAPLPVVPSEVVKLLAAFGPSSVKQIVSNLDTLLKRATEALAAHELPAATALLKLLDTSLLEETATVTKALTQTRLQKLVNFFKTIVVDKGAKLGGVNSDELEALASVILQILFPACEDSSIKDALGAVILIPLTELMLDDKMRFNQRRQVATCIISLLKGSKENKNRITDASFAALAFREADDFFFQMQCVEILFRMFKHKKTMLGEVPLAKTLKKGIEKLPNDTALMDRMITLIEAYNEEQDPPRVISFPVTRVEAANGATVCSATTLYFCSKFMLIMIPDSCGNNYVIPFNTFRSVRKTRDQKLQVRLTEIPEKLSEYFPNWGKDEDDSLYFSLSQESLQALFHSKVQQWIADVRAAHTLLKKKGDAEEKPSAKTGKRSRSNDPDEHIAAAVAPLAPEKKTRSELNRALPNRLGEETTEAHMFSELKLAMQQQVAVRRDAQSRALQKTISTIQSLVDENKNQSRKERDAFEADLHREIEDLKSAERAMQERVGSAVAELNQGLQEIQSVGQVVQENIATAETMFHEGVADVRKVEEEHLKSLKMKVDAEMKAMESNLMSFINAVQPLRFLKNYIVRKTEEDATIH